MPSQSDLFPQGAPKDPSHLPRKSNPWGQHDRLTFIPKDTLPVRCFKCHRLMSSDFFEEMQCPNCNWTFTKKDARDMYVEAKQVKVMGGWDRRKLEILQDKAREHGCTIRPDGSLDEVGTVARNLSRMSNHVTEQGLRQARAQNRMINHLLNLSDVSKRLRQKV